MNRRTGPFAAAVTLTRPEPAPYIDRNGVEQEAAANQPRFNYDAGQPEGLLLDSLLTEHAALVPDPAFNESAGTWVFTGALENARPLPGSGFDELLTGEGTLVLVYQGGAGQCWADGQLLYTVDPITPAMATAITAGGDARAAFHQYRPYAISDSEAAQLATGAFEIVTPPALLADLQAQEYGARDESGAFQRKPYSGVLDLTRPGPTTILDANGDLITVPTGQPALGPDGQQIVAFLVTNYALWSDSIEDWYLGNGVTVGEHEGNQAIFETPDSNNHSISLRAGQTDGAQYLRYIDCKPIGRRYVAIARRGFGSGVNPSGLPGGGWAVFDCDTNEWVTASQDFGFAILPNGFKRFYSYTPANSANDNKFGAWATDSVSAETNFMGDPEKGLAILRGQYLDANVQVYIPTDGTAAIQAADICYSGAPFADRYNPERGSLFVDFDLAGPGYAFQTEVDGATNNFNSLYIASSEVRLYGDGFYSYNGTGVSGRNKFALSWENDVVMLFRNGQLVYNGPYVMPDWTRALFFRRSNGGSLGAGHIKQFWLSDQPVTEQRGVELTTL